MQTDVETADLNRERMELEATPKQELQELAGIYEKRGLDKDLAFDVAKQLMKYNALEAHARDELGINDMTKPNPLQAAVASAASFISGGILPFLVAALAPIQGMVFYQYGFAIMFLALSGAIAAKMGGSSIYKSIWRICFWGTVAMFMTALVGYIFGVQTS